MRIDRTALLVGKIVANQLSIELMLRMILDRRTNPPLGVATFECYHGHVGNSYPLNFFTDYSTLGGLVLKFNEGSSAAGTPLIPMKLIDLRDAIAHGRLSKPEDENSPMQLVKFSKPTKHGTQVTLDFYALLNEEWLNEQIALQHDVFSILIPEIGGTWHPESTA